MAYKIVKIDKRVELCDLCGNLIENNSLNPVLRITEKGKVFDSITCKNFFIYKTVEAWIKYRQSLKEE